MKRTKITIETERELIISSRRRQRPRIAYVAWCEDCARVVAMITVDEAATLASDSSRSIYRQVENGRLHFAETPEGQLFICPRSLYSEYKIDAEE